jgi:hypothetical protein
MVRIDSTGSVEERSEREEPSDHEEPSQRGSIAFGRRRAPLMRLTNALYRLLIRILAAQPRSRSLDALIVYRLSRLHTATPPEKKLLTTSSSSATNQFWRKAGPLSPGVSALRLAPT